MLKHTQNHLGQPIGSPVVGWTPPRQPSRDVMKGRCCVLEPLSAQKHAAALFEANALDREGRNWTYLPYGPFLEAEAYEAWVDSWAASVDPLFFAVCNHQGQALGVAAYLRIVAEIGCIEVGHLNFSPRLQRTPAATEAMYLMMEHAFALGYRRYEWKCDALNAASRSAALRLGFRFEGIFRQATIYKGRSRDTAWFSIIDAEWPARKDAFVRWLAPENFDANGKQVVPLAELTLASDVDPHPVR
jgi:RimJ/RimL family protein N-acetyltransferase